MSIIFDNQFFKPLGKIQLDKPTGQLSGHNAGEPFSEEIFNFLKKSKSKNIFKQYEYLNKVFENKNREKISKTTLGLIISRGKEASKNWSGKNMFEEKQNDTADILYIDENTNGIIDIKTTNIEKKGQPPNIISSYKIAKFCKSLIEKRDENKIEFNYIGIDWRLIKNKLVSEKISVVDLFKIDPQKIYINWAAALQIQFHINKVDQSYKIDKICWANDYLKQFVSSAKNRIVNQKIRFIDPFIDILEN